MFIGRTALVVGLILSIVVSVAGGAGGLAITDANFEQEIVQSNQVVILEFFSPRQVKYYVYHVCAMLFLILCVK